MRKTSLFDGLCVPYFRQQNSQDTDPDTMKKQFSPGPTPAVFRVPEFKWSDVHLRILDDLFYCLEGDVDQWKG